MGIEARIVVYTRAVLRPLEGSLTIAPSKIILVIRNICLPLKESLTIKKNMFFFYNLMIPQNLLIKTPKGI